MDKVLITGGTGFVGYWMQQTQPKSLSVLYFGRSWWDVQTLSKYKYVAHLAPVEPTRAISCAKRNNARLLYCSSGIVYHPENDTEYRRNKIAWEQECLDSGADVVIARLFTFFGDRLDDNKAYTQFTKAAKANKPIRIWGDGSTVRSYMHGRELGRQMWAILLNGKSGEAYDVGDGKPVTMMELAYRIRRMHNSKSEIVFEDKEVPMPSYLPTDTAKTKKLLDRQNV